MFQCLLPAGLFTSIISVGVIHPSALSRFPAATSSCASPVKLSNVMLYHSIHAHHPAYATSKFIGLFEVVWHRDPGLSPSRTTASRRHRTFGGLARWQREGGHHNEESSNGSDKGRGVWEKRIHRSHTGDELNSYLTMLLVSPSDFIVEMWYYPG